MTRLARAALAALTLVVLAGTADAGQRHGHQHSRGHGSWSHQSQGYSAYQRHHGYRAHSAPRHDHGYAYGYAPPRFAPPAYVGAYGVPTSAAVPIVKAGRPPAVSTPVKPAGAVPTAAVPASGVTAPAVAAAVAASSQPTGASTAPPLEEMPTDDMAPIEPTVDGAAPPK